MYADAHMRVWVSCSQWQSWSLSLQLLRAPRRVSSPQRASGWKPLSREAGEAQSGVLKITQHSMVKRRRRSYGSILQSVIVSVCPSVCLSHTIEALIPQNNKDVYIFIIKSYGQSSFMYIHSLWLYNKNTGINHFWKKWRKEERK